MPLHLDWAQKFCLECKSIFYINILTFISVNQSEDRLHGLENLLKIGCAVYNIWPKNWLHKAEIFITSDLNIGCKNAHPCTLGFLGRYTYDYVSN